jgi:hypothetical protein
LLFVVWRVDAVGVVGEGREYFLVVFEEEGVVRVDTVKHQHVQRVHLVLAGHEAIKPQDELLDLSLGYVQLGLLQVELLLCLFLLLQGLGDLRKHTRELLRLRLGVLALVVRLHYLSGHSQDYVRLFLMAFLPEVALALVREDELTVESLEIIGFTVDILTDFAPLLSVYDGLCGG